MSTDVNIHEENLYPSLLFVKTCAIIQQAIHAPLESQLRYKPNDNSHWSLPAIVYTPLR